MRWNPFRKRKSVDIVCARKGESLLVPEGSVCRECLRCKSTITVAPLTIRKMPWRRMRLFCIQCMAVDEPDAPLGPMPPETIQTFLARQEIPVPICWTARQMANHMAVLFPRPLKLLRTDGSGGLVAGRIYFLRDDYLARQNNQVRIVDTNLNDYLVPDSWVRSEVGHG